MALGVSAACVSDPVGQDRASSQDTRSTTKPDQPYKEEQALSVTQSTSPGVVTAEVRWTGQPRNSVLLVAVEPESDDDALPVEMGGSDCISLGSIVAMMRTNNSTGSATLRISDKTVLTEFDTRCQLRVFIAKSFRVVVRENSSLRSSRTLETRSFGFTECSDAFTAPVVVHNKQSLDIFVSVPELAFEAPPKGFLECFVYGRELSGLIATRLKSHELN